MRAALRVLPLLLLSAACNQGVAPGLDLLTCDGGVCPDPGVIQGQVVYSGTSRGDAILLLFDTAALPPPDGTATAAIEVARVSQAQLFGSAPVGSAGPFAAPYVFTEVPSGHTYQVRAFLDVAHQFNPSFDFTLSPRAGSVAGGYGAIGSDGLPHLLPIAVAANQVVSGTDVALFQPLPFDPPSFVIAGGPQLLSASLSAPAQITLQTVKLTAPDASFSQAHFGVELDRDATGSPKSTFGNGIVDIFPRVVLQQIRDASGNAVTAGNAAVVPCAALATSIMPNVMALPVGAPPLPLDSVDVLVMPTALSAATHAPLPSIPKGVYAVVVIERSGQVWTLPNSLGLQSSGADFVTTQAEAVVFH
jgi:hypothetical protein